jgi:hypothetical protein
MGCFFLGTGSGSSDAVRTRVLCSDYAASAARAAMVGVSALGNSEQLIKNPGTMPPKELMPGFSALTGILFRPSSLSDPHSPERVVLTDRR